MSSKRSSPVDIDSNGDTSDVDTATLRHALTYPFTAGLRTVAIGTLAVLGYPLVLSVLLIYTDLGLLAVLFAVPFGLLLLGYGLRIGTAAMNGADAAPGYDDPKRLLVEGTHVLGISAPFVLTIGLLSLVPFLLGLFIAGVGAPVLLFIGLAGSYLLGAAFATLVATGSPTRSFRALRFLKLAQTRQYLIVWGKLAAVGLALGGVSAIVLGIMLAALWAPWPTIGYVFVVGLPYVFLVLAWSYFFLVAATMLGGVVDTSNSDLPLDVVELTTARLDDVTLEELYELKEQTEEGTPRERVLVAIGHKKGTTLETLAARHGVDERTIRNWLDRFEDAPIEHAPYDGVRPGDPVGTEAQSREQS